MDEFRLLDDPPGAYYELRHGEIIPVARPKYRYAKIQRRLRDSLNQMAGEAGVADTEFAFRPLPQHELWVADVAYVSAEREAAVDLDDNLRGSPDLVIEVLSPSNDLREIRAKAATCLTTGSLEFWLVDSVNESVIVYSEGAVQTYKSGDSLPVERFFPGAAPVSVIAIFSLAGSSRV